MSDTEDIHEVADEVQQPIEEIVDEPQENQEEAMSYTSRYGGGYGASSRYSTDSRRDSTGYSGSSYRRDSGVSRYSDYGSSRYTGSSSKYDSPRSYDYTSSRYGDPDRFSKYRQPSKEIVIEKSYDEAPAIVTEAPVEEEHQEALGTEVLQESDVDHFSADPVVEEPVDEVLQYTESQPEEVEPEPAREKTPEPVYVTETTIRRTSLSSPNENRNPDVNGSPKKLGGSVWPPRNDSITNQNIPEEGGPGKKRVSDLIARFNAGNVENDTMPKNDQRYKQEYGAVGRNGKVQQSVFQ